MDAFTTLNALVVPLDRANVDTDAIIPKQFLKSIKRSGFGPNLFDEWRYRDHGEPGQDCSKRPLNPEFVLNQPRYQGAQILLARDNIGCGSSREHAAWALLDYGIRCVIAPSFADIFYSNCFKNGILALTLPPATVDQLFKAVFATPGYTLRVDLAQQHVLTPAEQAYPFALNAGLKQRLLNGLDDIGVTLQREQSIRDYEAQRKLAVPWL